MQKLFKYHGAFDDEGNWADNMDELNDELKNGWKIANTLLEKSLRFSKKSKSNDSAFEGSDIVVAQLVLEKKYHEDPYRLEIGLGLIPLVDKGIGGKLLKEIGNLREKIHFPKIRIVDNPHLEQWEYKLFSYDVFILDGLVNEKESTDEQASSIGKAIEDYLHRKYDDPKIKDYV